MVLPMTTGLCGRRYQTERSAYTESGATYNANSDAEKISRTTVALGIYGEYFVGPGAVLFGAGIDHDISSETAHPSGTSDLLGMETFDIASDEERNSTRGFASLGYAMDLANGARFTVETRASRAADGNKPDLGLAFGYEMRF